MSGANGGGVHYIYIPSYTEVPVGVQLNVLKLDFRIAKILSVVTLMVSLV